MNFESKKCITWKLRILFYLADNTEDLNPGYSLSGSSEGLLQKGKGGKEDREEFSQQRPGSWNLKRLLLDKENSTAQVNEFSTFLCIRRWKALGSLKSFFWYAPGPPREGFPGSSAGKESSCNARDPGSIPGSGRSPGAGVGYPLQYSWASLVAQP